MSAPNVLFIITDQWRGDCLGTAGHPDVKTPYLDTLCAEGFRFKNAYSATPTCIPARAALYTGMAQENHRRVGYRDGVRWDYPATLAGCFADAGYQCHCAGKLHVHPLRNSVGYHSVDLHDGYLHYYRKPEVPYSENQRIADDYFYWLQKELGIDADPIDTGIDCNSWVGRPWPYAESTHPTRWVTDRGIDFLRKRDRDKPFFLTLSYVRPHPPFDAPEPFWAMYRGKELTPPKHGDWDDIARLARDGRIVDSETGPVDPELLEMAQMGYYAAMTQVDYEIGRLRDALFAQGLDRSNTIIVFVSDHGELLGDHCLYRKSLPYEGSAHVPLIISASREALERAGYTGRTAVTEKLAELRDVMPTLLSLCGIDVPDSVDGINLFGDADRQYLHGEHLYDGESCQWITAWGNGHLEKFIWFSGDDRRQYFDLTADPEESHNGIADPLYAERIAALEKVLTDTLAWREEGFVRDGRLTPGASCKPVLEHGLRECR
ncbi:MAG: arylsulfatase [Clostridia bacterium]|nr:arylsulfatase [Clostridia bacterium]